MALYGRDANGNDAYIRGTGTGAAGLGYLTFHDVFSDDVKFATVAQVSGGLIPSEPSRPRGLVRQLFCWVVLILAHGVVSRVSSIAVGHFVAAFLFVVR